MSTAPSTLSGLTPKAINWSIALSILLILAGLFAILIPPISGLAVTLLIGWAMIISSITHFIFAFKTHTTGSLFWELLLGAVYLFAGGYLLFHPLAGLLSLTLLLPAYLFVEAILELIYPFQFRPRPAFHWLSLDPILTPTLAL